MAPWLVIGPALEPGEYRRLAAEGVTRVVDLRAEASDDAELLASFGLASLNVPVEDGQPPTAEQWAEVRDWLAPSSERPAASPQPVAYLHCQGGLGRTPTMAIALLMSRGFSRTEAHRLVVGAYPVAAPTPAQQSWLDSLSPAARQADRQPDRGSAASRG